MWQTCNERKSFLYHIMETNFLGDILKKDIYFYMNLWRLLLKYIQCGLIVTQSSFLKQSPPQPKAANKRTSLHMSWWSTPDICWLAYVIMTIVWHEHTTWDVKHVTTIKRTMFDRGREVINWPVSLSSVGAYSHSNSSLCHISSIVVLYATSSYIGLCWSRAWLHQEKNSRVSCQKGPLYLPCVSMAGRALLAGYPQIPTSITG